MTILATAWGSTGDPRRHAGLAIALTMAILVAASGQASAQAPYPAKPLRLIVPISAGGGTDLIARLIQPKLVKALGQPVVVDNRPGGNTTIGMGLAAKAPPDGYTLLLVNANFTINAALSKHLPYQNGNIRLDQIRRRLQA